MSESDVALLPTLDDTFGWSAVEAMSVGTPVIGTNVCAMPEIIVHGSNGYMVEVELQPNRRWAGLRHPAGSPQRRAAVEAVYERLVSGIVSHVLTWATDRGWCRDMGQAAMRWVEQEYSPARVAARLRAVYEEALS
jgi:glycosyltransferase involved in cell wall biosynthesis